MENGGAIEVSDILLIFSKDTLFSEESVFFDDLTERNTRGPRPGKLCGGILYGEPSAEKVRLVSSTPSLLAKRIRQGRLFVK